jgi:hypothetical protein
MRRTVFDPTMPLETTPFSYAPRPASLQGLRLGLVENTKFNSKELLCKVAERLEQRHGMRMVYLERKKSSGHAVSEEAISLFRQQVDLVLSGVGD